MASRLFAITHNSLRLLAGCAMLGGLLACGLKVRCIFRRRKILLRISPRRRRPHPIPNRPAQARTHPLAVVNQTPARLLNKPSTDPLES